jgi:hypothetical protein
MTGTRNRRRKPSELKATAYHEAGHIVAAFDQNVRVISADIIPIGDRNGHVKPEGSLIPKGDFLRTFIDTQIIVSLAGPVAEQMFTGRDVGTKSDDLEAEKFARAANPDPE